MPNIQLSAVIEIRPEFIADFERTVDDLTTAAAAEPGLLEYRIWRDRTDPHRFLILERYLDQQALDTHRALPTVQAFVTALPTWLAISSRAALHTTEEFGTIPLNTAVPTQS
ncbi:putative quinol monooxygenase [Nocardia stercoris]|uniref:Antibiotic biosynthesis monooxygenase n=1 Tax=Nocardia stercoris TaxID=2483361 RepID=A0A3M2KZX7_9NOCA|nr:putative quinol monooxygenase [Nocardia stercoris]RMI30871.1 antibiotic biosynthesis monooxygenase [Nocardia stercoris]